MKTGNRPQARICLLDGKQIVSGSNDKTIKIWNVSE